MEAVLNTIEDVKVAEISEQIEELSIAQLSTIGGGLAVLFY